MPSFAEALYSLPTEKLLDLIRLRGVDPRRLSLVPNKRSLVQQITGEFNKQASVSAAIVRCSARELRLLQLATSVETTRGFTWTKLVELAGGPSIETAIGTVAGRLEKLGLMFRVGPTILVPESVRHLTPTSLSDRYTLARLLNMYDAPAIRRIVYKLGLEEEHATKSSHIEAIRGYLLASLPTLRLNPALTDAELGVVEFMGQNGGSCTPFEVAAIVSDGSADDFFRYEWQNRWKQGKERNAVDSLIARGILYVVTSGYGYNLFLVIPSDALTAIIGARSASFWTDPPPSPKALTEPPVQTRRHTTIVRDIVCMLSFFGVQTASRTSTGYIHKSSLKTVSRMLSVADEQYASFVYAICREAGLAAPEGERQLYGITSAGKNWLHLDSSEQISALFESWRRGVVWAEMYDEPLMRKNEYRNRDAAVAARDSVLPVLAELNEQNSFTSIESISSTLTYMYPLLLDDSSEASPGAGGALTAFVRTLITETLYWLGFVEVGFDASAARVTTTAKGETTQRLAVSSITGFRLTPAGAILLRPDLGHAVPEEPRENVFVVQANADIFIPPYLEPSLLYRLLMITDLPAAGVAGATTTLTRESIRRAFDLGDTPEQMLNFLRSHSRTGIPQNVEYLINEVGSKHGHIHVGTAHMYLQVNSPMLMKELQSRRELKGYFVRALNDTVAILSADDIEKVLKDLRKAGYLPVSDEGGSNQPFAEAEVKAPKLKTVSGKTSTSRAPAQNQDPYSAVDWERIAREDGAHWHNQSPISTADVAKPPGAYDNPSLIRVMLHNACITHNIVDLVWREIGQEPYRTLFEPVRMAGNTVTGFSQGSEELVNLEIETIRWARLTPDKY